MISKYENPDYFFLYPDSDLDHSQNLKQSKLDQTHLLIIFFQEDPTNFICVE